MISQATKEKLKKLGIDPEALETAVKSDTETDIAVPDGELLTADQLTERDSVKLKEGKKEGEKEALTIARKELAKHGLQTEKDRWGDIAEEIKTKINATGDEKVKLLQEQNTALLADKETLSQKFTQAEQALANGMFEVERLTKLPAHVAGLSPKETLELLKLRGYLPEKTENGVVWKKNGEALKDKATHAPLPEDAAIASIWEAEKWNAPAAPAPNGGRGGGDSNPGGAGIKTQSAAVSEWQRQNPGKNPVSPECQAYIQEIAKADTTFNWAA